MKPGTQARAPEVDPTRQLREATARLAAALTTEEVCDTFLTATESIFDAAAAVIYLADERGDLRLLGGRGVPHLERLAMLPREARIPLADAVRTGEPLCFPDHAAFVAQYPHMASTMTPAARLQAIAAFPLIHDARVHGGFALSFDSPREFPAAELERLAHLARQCAVALERTHLYLRERRARAEAETLLRVAGSVSSAQLDLEAVVQKVTDESTALVGAKFGAFFYNVVKADGEAFQLFTLSGAPRAAFEELGLPRNTPIFAPTFNGEGVVRIDDVRKDPRYGTMSAHHGMPGGHLPVTSYLAVPVISRGGSVLGGLFFGHPEAGRFTADHERLVEGLAGIAAAALDNAMLFKASREAEERHRRVADELAETVRLNELFIGVLAHDLRNPLAGITAAATLATGRNTDDRMSAPLSRITAGAERMSRMVEQLLDVARLRLGQGLPLAPAPADLLAVVRRVADELQDARHAAKVTITQAGEARGTWDADRLAQLFSNLVGNALQHGSGDEVVIDVDGRAAETTTVRVRNQGAIPDARIPTLFDPFSAGSRSGEGARGLGLGLFIAREIARAHGGGLAVDSSQEAGTTLTVTLPRHVTAAPAEALPRNRALVEAQERAWQSEQRMRLLVDSIRDYGIFMLDLQGRVASWNTGACRIKGYRAEEIIGKHISVFYDEEDRARGRADTLLALAATHGSTEDLGWRVRKDGSRFWADVIITALRDSRGELCGFAKVTRDLTDRREQEERLRHSEEQIRLMVESVRDYAIFKLDPQGIVSTWNAGAQRIEGYRPEEIIGQHFSVFYDAAEVRSGKCEMELEAAAREGHFEDEGWRVRKDGSRFWANVVITSLRDQAGTLVGFTKVTRDLTERRKLDDERLQRARAEESVRLRDEFLTMVSHELKTPLTGLQLQLQTLVRRVAETDTHLLRDARRAAASGDRLEALIELLLDVGSIAEGRIELRREPMDLVGMVEEIVEGFRSAASRVGSEITLHHEGALEGDWDPLRIEQVVSSLLSNAIKYGAGGPIEISLRGRSDDVLLEVRDHGPGVAPADMEELFERFARRGSTRNHGGLGLGLYLVRQIARAHGGRAHARNERDGGACFTVELPRAGGGTS